MHKITMTLPNFPGFYESVLDSGIDSALELICDGMAEDSAQSHGCDASEIADAIYYCASFDIAHQAIAKAYAEQFANEVNDTLSGDSEPLAFEYESMTSPREYNFTTDRVFLTLPINQFQWLFDNTKRETLEKTIRDNFTSRSGFISFYSNDIADWLDKPLAEWDHNEAGTLLAAYVADTDLDRDNDLQWKIYERINEEFYSATSECIDWEKLDERLKETAADKVTE